MKDDPEIILEVSFFRTKHGQSMILLHGFVKKSQKTPQHELATTKKRLRQLNNPSKS